MKGRKMVRVSVYECSLTFRQLCAVYRDSYIGKVIFNNGYYLIEQIGRQTELAQSRHHDA